MGIPCNRIEIGKLSGERIMPEVRSFPWTSGCIILTGCIAMQYIVICSILIARPVNTKKTVFTSDFVSSFRSNSTTVPGGGLTLELTSQNTSFLLRMIIMTNKFPKDFHHRCRGSLQLSLSENYCIGRSSGHWWSKRKLATKTWTVWTLCLCNVHVKTTPSFHILVLMVRMVGREGGRVGASPSPRRPGPAPAALR